MLSSITSQKLVDTVANNTILEFYHEAEKLGLSNDQVHDKVNEFISSPLFVQRVGERMEELAAKFNVGEVTRPH